MRSFTALDIVKQWLLMVCLSADRIEKMWVQNGAAFFFGPIFIYPEETEHEPTKMFYKREVFLSNMEETCPMACILGNV